MAQYKYLDDNGLLYYHQKLMTAISSQYVAKVTGKDLSTNDFTNALKNKLDGIASGAEVNVQSDWSEATTTSDAFIKNKPTKVSDFTNDSGFQTAAQVQSAISSAVVIDSSLSSTSTNPVQNKVINTALAEKLPDYTIVTRPPWTGGVHPTLFCTVDYTNNDSENGSFFKISMICTHGNGTAFRFFQDAIINVSYVGAVSVDIYRYFGTTVPSSYSYGGRQYGDIFWTVDTTNKLVSFYILMGQFVRMKSTPYKFLGNTERGVISQAHSGTEYSGAAADIAGWANIGDLGILRSGTTRPSFKGNDLALYSDVPSDSLIYYAVSSTGASDNNKVATTTSGNLRLETGVTVQVYFANRCSGSPAYLNVDGTGNIRISTKGDTATGTYNIWEAGEIVGFTYTGTYWVCWGRNSASLSGYGRTYLTESATANYNYTSLTPSSLNNFAQNIVAGAPVYSTSSTYAVGDRCRHGFYVYECKTAITTPEAWTASHWQALDSLQAQIDDIKATLETLLHS